MGGNIGAIIEKIKPAIDKSKDIEKCINYNVKESIKSIRKSSDIIRHLEKEGKLKIVGMKYFLSTGKVQVVE